MKQILRIVLNFLIASVSITCYANQNDEITLVVTSDGFSKDDATKNALRAAIEQTYGVFVSANTDILNDELIKDEVVTLSSGNIKKYTEIAYLSDNDNHHTITLNVTVSKAKLQSYAKSKGAECELDGASLASDIELQILYKKNEELAVRNLINEFLLQLDKCFNYDIYIDKFTRTPFEERWIYDRLAMRSNELADYGTRIDKIEYSDDSVSVPFKVIASLNDNAVSYINQFFEKLEEISIHDTKLDKNDRYNNRKRYFQPPFVEKIEPAVSYSDLPHIVYKYPELLFRSPKSVRLLFNLFCSTYDDGDSPIRSWLSDCYVDLGNENSNESNVKVLGEACIFDVNLDTHSMATYHREDAKFNRVDFECFVRIGKIVLPIAEVKKLKTIKVVHK